MDKWNRVAESKQVNDLKKKAIFAHNKQNHGEKELLKEMMKGIDKLNIKESKDKSSTESKMCLCAPTTHQGSFKCRLHHKKSATNKD